MAPADSPNSANDLWPRSWPESAHNLPPKELVADVFCRVIDNLGDLGVSWRLSHILAQRGWQVRLWTDDASALKWMAPESFGQGIPGVQTAGVSVWDWHQASEPLVLAQLTPASLWVEAFACELPHAFVAHAAATRSSQPRWVNLEYLSAEPWVSRMHGLPSPVMNGPAKGWTKQFIFPGFSRSTGGLLQEDDLVQRQSQFDADRWWTALGLPLQPGALRISLFCYEPAPLASWLRTCALAMQHSDSSQWRLDLLVTPGRATAAMTSACQQLGWPGLPEPMRWHALPWLSQTEFDHLLWACDINCIRGEDSLVRALWAGKPLLWQLYPQTDLAHHTKLEAFLDWAQWPDAWAQLHRIWNDLPNAPSDGIRPFPMIAPDTLSEVQTVSNRLRASLLQLPPLQRAVEGRDDPKPKSSESSV